ncbi:oxidoreductase [Bacillus sp. EB106-08-02-XG196]|uniref:WD40/YVTN/BNR-like repeat-containing protein n=1 Tax=Bacillus sp. EB106-08-02-XG196 TaxID=2737049 RepID=UPI0015C49DF3|nr:oxidoreductase [Bacillus sp. EB106-08-02-XG196]NWQ42763.1 oxidoreductase [Bacillus sp. EB106-08-02-XG196]
MKNIIIGTIFIMICITVATFFFEMHQELTTPELKQPIEEQDTKVSETPQPSPLQPIFEDDSIGYSLQNNQLQITFNKGSDWVIVPVENAKFFAGEYNGNEQELIENSYILTQNRSAFLYSEGSSIKLKYSLNQGETWEDSVITVQYPPIRFRKVEFLNESFGYVIISGDRTMSQEWTTVYVTNNGGKQWKETAHSDVTRLIYDGGFVDENTGFLSFGILNPVEPDLYVTQDSGNSWHEANITIPEKYHEIFVMAEVPFKEEDHLAVNINQGPNGDYQGGKIKGKFISNDNGTTWEFSMEVE